MKVTTTDCRRGIRFTLTTYLEELDYADDISLLSSWQRDMHEKTDRLTETAQKLGLKVNTSKTKLMKMNRKSNDPVTINNSDIDDVNEFTYLGSKIAKDGDSEVNSRITKANQSFAMLKSIWKSKQVGTNTKLRIFKSNVLSILLYGAECWKLTTRIAHKIHTFQNKCFRKILMETSSKNTMKIVFLRNEQFQDMAFTCRSPEDYSVCQIWIY